MTNSIVINDKSRKIEITKKFAAAAKYFGSQEYKMLQKARTHYPDYYVKVRSAARKADHFKGLTFDYMEGYIKKHKTALRLKCLTEILKNLPLDSILSAGLRFSPTASTPLPLRSSLATFTRALPSRPAAADSPLAAK